MRQLELFDAEERSKEFWEMSRGGVADAASLLIGLLREGSERVTFAMIVKRKMGLAGDSVPDALARTFADAIEAVTEERLRIKEAVEDFGEYRLCVIDQLNRSAIRGGPPAGFSLRESAVGRADEAVQAHMTVAKLEKIAKRRVSAGLLSAEESSRAIGGVRGVLAE
jgi:hypothetical protein